jgi:hypothetical protein
MKALKITAVALLIGFAGTAGAQTAPGLTVRLIAPASVAAGTQQKIATVQLTAGADMELKAIPVTVSGSGMSNCTLRDPSGTALSQFSFVQPFPITSGAVVNLSLHCDTTANAAGTVSVPLNTVVATANGGAVAVAGAPSGTPTATVGSGSATPGVPNTGGTTTVPGIPNTGAGDPGTLILLAIAAAVALGAGVYAFRHARA